MVCPLRFVVAFASVLLLLYASFVLLVDSEAGDRLLARARLPGRSWWRFAASFFTG